MNIPFLVMAQFAGRPSRQLPARAIAGGGCLVTAAGILTFSTLTPSSPCIIAVIGYVLFGTGTGMWIPGVANVAMRDVPPGLSGTASGVFNASRQVGTSIGLAILGAIGADAATSAWTSQAAHLPGAARRAAIRQARNVASARISSVTRALGDGSPASRRTGLLSRLPGGSPHRRTWPHRRRDHRRIRATRQPQTRAGRSRRQACTTRRPRPATPHFRHTT